MNAAIESGAQIISTDYYRPDPRYANSSHWTNYSVSFDEGRIAIVNHSLNQEEFALCNIEE